MLILESVACGDLHSGIRHSIFSCSCWYYEVTCLSLAHQQIKFCCLMKVMELSCFCGSRGKSATPVRSLITRDINGSSVVFVLHEDGTLRLWDILHRSRLLNYFLPSTPEFAGQYSSSSSLHCMVLMGAKGSPVIYIFLNKMGVSN